VFFLRSMPVSSWTQSMEKNPTYEELLQRVRDLEGDLCTYRTLVHDSPDLFYRTDLQGRIVYISPSVYPISGYTVDEAIGMDMANEVYLFPEESKAFLAQLREHGRVNHFEARLKRKDGSVWWASTNAHFFRDRDGTILGVEGITRDTSGQKRIQKELEETRAMFEAAIRHSPSGILIADAPDVRIRFANPAALYMRGERGNPPNGFDMAEYTSRWQVFHPDGTPCDSEDLPLFRAIVRGETVNGVEVILRHESGKERWVSANAAPIRDEEGRVRSGIVVFHDITDRVRAEAAVRESEERFRTLVEASPLGFSLIGKDGRYRYINPRFEEMFGYTIEDIPMGRTWFTKAFPDETQRWEVMEAWMEDLREAGVGQCRPRVFTVTCRDGARKEILFRPVTMENREQVVIYEDITERSRWEEQLRQAQRFKAVGTLAGGVAHDFNNLLMGIQGRASLMGLELGPSHPLMEHIEAIEEHVQSATNLTRQLLGFARGGKYEITPVDLNHLVPASGTLFGRTRKEIRMHIRTDQGPLVVEADMRQIEQVLLNLYVNAWQAMPGGGDIYLETSKVLLDEASFDAGQVSPGVYARISVTDTGIGMDEATRQRSFDPFFTTKEKERGTGLGLASAYGIVKNHGGLITVYSEPGHGTTFNVYLPASNKEVPAEAVIEVTAAQGAGTILVVDDEEMIIEVCRAMLEKLGYRVLAAGSPERALQMMNEKRDDIDLVILDLVMPGMDGGTVFDRLQEIRPDIPVLLSSGYALNGQAESILRRGCSGFIQKPYNISDLSQKLRQILDKEENT